MLQPELTDNLYKIVVVGDYKVGKTSLIARFCDDYFRETHAATIGIDYKIRTVILPDKSRVRLEIFDTAGLEKFRPIASAYYQNASGIMIVYDTTDVTSFENVQRYARELKYYIPPDAEILVVGNKADMVDERQVSFEVADALTSRLNISLFEASAKTGENVEGAFFELAQKIQDKVEIGAFDGDNLIPKVVIDGTEKVPAGGWCNLATCLSLF